MNGLRFSDFTITFDLDCQSPETYIADCVMMFTFEYLDFDILIMKNHFVKEIVPEIKFKRISPITVRRFPDNAFTQIIGTEVIPAAFPPRKTDANTKFIAAMTQWEGIIQRLYEKAVKEVPFPELCYYCP